MENAASSFIFIVRIREMDPKMEEQEEEYCRQIFTFYFSNIGQNTHLEIKYATYLAICGLLEFHKVLNSYFAKNKSIFC